MHITLRHICILLASLLFMGCSVFSITYNYADTFIRWQLDDYFDLTPEQKKWIKPRLSSLVAWHRQEEMPRYAVVLQNVKDQGQDGYTLEELTAIAATANLAYLRLVDYVLDDAVDFLLQLTPKQIDHLEKYLTEKHQERIKERGVTAQEQHQYGQKMFIENIEKWTGKLTPKQVEQFTQLYSLSRTRGGTVDWDVRRQASQQAWVAMLRSAPDRSTLRAWLENWFKNGSTINKDMTELPNTSPAPTRAERMEKNLANTLVIDNALTATQRQQALNTLQKWIDRIQGVL